LALIWPRIRSHFSSNSALFTIHSPYIAVQESFFQRPDRFPQGSG
jgi:hypothetical protein